ncbi:MAG TPA: hypothetical protein VFW33_06940 [Gemmataceae bacterium]|nr:hypothetical protein [Gemmataceae bacterium]
MSTPGQPRQRRKPRPSPPIGRARGPDGAERDVYEDADGRQYVLGAQGEKVYGLWLLNAPARPPAPPEEPADDEGPPDPEEPLEEATAAPEEAPWDQGEGVRRDRERHRGRLLGVLGTVAFCVGVMAVPSGLPGLPGLALALYVRSAARRDLTRMGDGSMDPEGEAPTRAALQDANLAAVLSGAGLLVGTLAAVGLLFYFT